MSVQAQSHRPSLSRKRRLAIFERDSFHCVYCGCHCPGGDGRSMAGAPTIDHVIPIVQGGTNKDDNLATACHRCNTAKHNQTPDQWYGRICARYDHDETRI